MDDELMARIRARAADPERRTEVRRTRFESDLPALDVGGLLAGLRRMRADLDRSIAAARAGRVDPDALSHADEIEGAMSSRPRTALPPTAAPDAIGAAEDALGVRLPGDLRRMYAEIADGGFGPGHGLMPLASIVERYAELQGAEELPRGATWPAGLLPVVDRDGGCDCVEASTGRIVSWDPEGLTERSNRARFDRSFTETAPSVEAWLRGWLDAKTFEERMADQVADARIRQAREARARIAARTPEERAAMGLPEVGWERVVWGGIGLEDDERSSHDPS